MVPVDTDALVAAAQALGRAGQLEPAAALLAAATPDDPVERARLALTAAAVAADNTWWRLDPTRPDAELDRAAEAVAAAPADATRDWDLAMVRLRVDYAWLLFSEKEPDPELARRAEALRASAPDSGRGGWIAFYAGVIYDNVDSRPDLARERYAEALAEAEATGDELLASYALRHQGGHAEDDGDVATAAALAWRSVELREKLGFVPGTLAQRVMVAQLLAATDPAGATALARDIARAADARGWTRVAAQARAITDAAS